MLGYLFTRGFPALFSGRLYLSSQIAAISRHFWPRTRRASVLVPPPFSRLHPFSSTLSNFFAPIRASRTSSSLNVQSGVFIGRPDGPFLTRSKCSRLSREPPAGDGQCKSAKRGRFEVRAFVGRQRMDGLDLARGCIDCKLALCPVHNLCVYDSIYRFGACRFCLLKLRAHKLWYKNKSCDLGGIRSMPQRMDDQASNS